MPRAAFLLLLSGFLLLSTARSQDPTAPRPIAAPPDTIRIEAAPVDSVPVDSARRGAGSPGVPRVILPPGSGIAAGDTGLRQSKSSWTAVGLSAVLPGAGQVYTENYWKVPVIWGLGGYWVYEWIRNDDRYVEFRDLYASSVATSPPLGDDRYLRLREAYKDRRDSFAWYIGVLYLLNVVDAYVGAELYDFDVSPDLAGGGATASVRFRL